jgi:hypothetical protein
MQLPMLGLVEPIQEALVDLSKSWEQTLEKALALGAQLDHHRPSVPGVHAVYRSTSMASSAFRKAMGALLRFA